MCRRRSPSEGGWACAELRRGSGQVVSVRPETHLRLHTSARRCSRAYVWRGPRACARRQPRGGKTFSLLLHAGQHEYLLQYYLYTCATRRLINYELAKGRRVTCNVKRKRSSAQKTKKLGAIALHTLWNFLSMVLLRWHARYPHQRASAARGRARAARSVFISV